MTKRLRNPFHDYSRESTYFITLNTKCDVLLSRIYDSNVFLTKAGIIVDNCLKWITKKYSYVQIYPYVIMPDHVHLLIEISEGAGRDRHLPKKPLYQLIGAIKTMSSKRIRLIGYDDFKWQRSFHDIIIKNKRQLQNVGKYIINNPRVYEQNKNKKQDI